MQLSQAYNLMRLVIDRRVLGRGVTLLSTTTQRGRACLQNIARVPRFCQPFYCGVQQAMALRHRGTDDATNGVHDDKQNGHGAPAVLSSRYATYSRAPDMPLHQVTYARHGRCPWYNRGFGS